MIMPTLKEYREEAGLSIAQLARMANVDFSTAKKADDSRPIRRIKALAIVKAISSALGRTIPPEEIDGLQME